jgi:hypothetical protein
VLVLVLVLADPPTAAACVFLRVFA